MFDILYTSPTLTAISGAIASQGEVGGADSLGLPHLLAFMVIIAFGVFTVARLIVEAISSKRTHLAGIFFSVGGTVLAYELFLFTRTMF